MVIIPLSLLLNALMQNVSASMCSYGNDLIGKMGIKGYDVDLILETYGQYTYDMRRFWKLIYNELST